MLAPVETIYPVDDRKLLRRLTSDGILQGSAKRRQPSDPSGHDLPMSHFMPQSVLR